jgi:hypothetical protein
MWKAGELPRATGVEAKPDATVKVGSVIDGPDGFVVGFSHAATKAAAVKPVRVSCR